MFLRVLRFVNAVYAPTVLGLYLVMFVSAFACMFIFPPASIVIVLIGVLGISAFWLVGVALKALLVRIGGAEFGEAGEARE